MGVGGFWEPQDVELGTGCGCRGACGQGDLRCSLCANTWILACVCFHMSVKIADGKHSYTLLCTICKKVFGQRLYLKVHASFLLMHFQKDFCEIVDHLESIVMYFKHVVCTQTSDERK